MDVASVDPTQPIGDALGTIGGAGILGALLIIALGVAAYFYIELRRERAARIEIAEARLEDAKGYTANLIKSAEGTWKLTEAHARMSTSVDRLLESVTRLLAVVESRKM